MHSRAIRARDQAFSKAGVAEKLLLTATPTF